MITYWLTLAISKEDLAEALDCKIEDVESQDYIGTIRDFAEVIKLEVVEDADQDATPA